jgi:phage shock protein PspC (stress-responsive transcriptional regulator)
MALKTSSKATGARPRSFQETLLRAWHAGSLPTRVVVALVITLLLFGMLLYFFAKDQTFLGQSTSSISFFFWVLAIFLATFIRAHLTIKREQEFNNRVKLAQDRASKNPERAAPAWELARLNLEKYLERNLGQVKWIFVLVVVVMSCGFGIIIYGVWKLYQNPSEITPALISAASGILTQFIGTTFLFIYKSTLAQAKDYVGMLERINAVGMSVQILDSLDRANPQLRDNAKVTVAHELLKFYAGQSMKTEPKKKGEPS